jgi:hypothetical protein
VFKKLHCYLDLHVNIKHDILNFLEKIVVLICTPCNIYGKQEIERENKSVAFEQFSSFEPTALFFSENSGVTRDQ